MTVYNYIDEKKARNLPIRYSHTEDVRILFAAEVDKLNNPFNLNKEQK